MPAVPIIMAVAAVAGIGLGAYSAVDSASQADDAKKQFGEQQASARKLQKDFEDQQSNLEKSTAGKDAKSRQQKIAAGATGRGDTILTGPGGIPGAAPGTQKTLLGL